MLPASTDLERCNHKSECIVFACSIRNILLQLITPTAIFCGGTAGIMSKLPVTDPLHYEQQFQKIGKGSMTLPKSELTIYSNNIQ
jgi:hypothetical protein